MVFFFIIMSFFVIKKLHYYDKKYHFFFFKKRTKNKYYCFRHFFFIFLKKITKETKVEHLLGKIVGFLSSSKINSKQKKKSLMKICSHKYTWQNIEKCKVKKKKKISILNQWDSWLILFIYFFFFLQKFPPNRFRGNFIQPT